jgi:hypothetical protein
MIYWEFSEGGNFAAEAVAAICAGAKRIADEPAAKPERQGFAGDGMRIQA